jgi:hypothetical protein
MGEYEIEDEEGMGRNVRLTLQQLHGISPTQNCG